MKARILFLLLFLPLGLLAQLSGKVVSVTDGDTFILLTGRKDQVRVRLHGIDCPERGQAYGNKAKQFTTAKIFGERLQVKVSDTDRYGRVIGIVIMNNGKILNEELLKAGLAWHYKYYDRNPLWAEMQEKAMAGRKGLWKDAAPVAPWELRKKKKRATAQ